MPNGDLKPDVQAEDFRVYRTVADLDSQVVEDVNGYKIARLLRDTFASVFSNDVRQMFSKRGIDAVGFEIAVDAQDGAGGAPLIDVQGAIGLQAVVFTDPHPDSSPGPHVYAFAKQGEGGIEPMDEGLRGDFGKFSATFFVAHFRGDAKATSAIWEAGLSYCEGTGLLSGTAYLRARHENEVIRGRQDMWLVTTVELSLKYGDEVENVGDIRFCITFSSFKHGEWLRNLVKAEQPQSKLPPPWEEGVAVRDLLSPRVGGDERRYHSFWGETVETDGSEFVIDYAHLPNPEPVYLFGGNYSILHELSSERTADWLREWTDTFQWESDGDTRPGFHVARVPAYGTEAQHCLAMQPKEKLLQPDDWEYDEVALRKLDDLVAQCERHGVRLILTLTNYWPTGGGIPAYLERAGIDPKGDEGNYTQNQKAKFYKNTEEANFKDAFKGHIDEILERKNHITGRRYKDDPTIMLWELANEPQPAGTTGQPDSTSLLTWIDDMSCYIKKEKGAKQLVSTGMDGGGPNIETGPEKYVPEYYVEAHKKKHIDAWSVHPWVDGEDFTDHWELGKDEGAKVILNHAKVAEANDMPCYVGELGWGHPEENEPANRIEAFELWKPLITGEDLPENLREKLPGDVGENLSEKQRVDTALVWQLVGRDQDPDHWTFGVFSDHYDTLEPLREIAKTFGKRNVY